MDINGYHCPDCGDTFDNSFTICPNYGCTGEVHVNWSAACDERCPA